MYWNLYLALEPAVARVTTRAAELIVAKAEVLALVLVRVTAQTQAIVQGVALLLIIAFKIINFNQFVVDLMK